MQIAQPKPKLAEQLFRAFEQRPRLILALLVLACLGPFIAKPFNMDDPLFIWAARHIQSHPFDPYGFNVNWYNGSTPMWQVTKNPPLSCYYLALAASLLGWSEPALHGAFLLPAIAVILGTYRLARQFCERPAFAACATLLTPVFLVSSTSVMCDTLMLTFWVWAVVFWVEGLESKNKWPLAVSAILVTLAVYTKYFGISLVPLLAAYTLVRKRRLGSWAWYFLIPIAGIAIYQWGTFELYGRGLFSDAGAYAKGGKNFNASKMVEGMIALSFTGGCLATASLLAFLLWNGRMLVGIGGTAAAYALAIFIEGTIWTNFRPMSGTFHWLVTMQTVFWVIGGVNILAMTAAEVWQRRDSCSWLLAFWIFGTLIFAGFVNWVANGRSILPMAPAVGILLARRLQSRTWGVRQIDWRWPYMVLTASGAFAFLVTFNDFEFARANRALAQETWAKYGQGRGTLWFGGHWGWEYYMTELGAKAVISGQTIPKAGDFLARSRNNTNPLEVNKNLVQPIEIIFLDGPKWLTTANTQVGAGFYASLWGPLPFAFGNVPPEAAFIDAIKPLPSTHAAVPPVGSP